MNHAAGAGAQAAFIAACTLDVAVRKPGNVSVESAGHGMQAQQFIASAIAAAGPLFEPGARVGRRIEGAVQASWQSAGCNTNLGIVLLCAPIAAALEQPAGRPDAASIAAVLGGLDVHDAAAAYRAIAMANPGGLGEAAAQDVHAPPSVTLREAMALAAQRDMIARQYANGFAELLEGAAQVQLPGFPPMLLRATGPVEPALAGAVQRVYLYWLARWPDSHIVRKHGEAVAQTVMRAAQAWEGVSEPQHDPAYAAWDESLKAARINPGTSADLTVATLLLAALR